MNTSFHGDLRVRLRPPGRCRRSPSATAVGDDVSVVDRRLRPEHAFPCRVGHEAVHGAPRAAACSTSTSRPASGRPTFEIRHLLSHTSGFDCELPERDLARFGSGDGALPAVVDELPARAPVRRRRGGVVVREHRLLARRAPRGGACGVDVRGRAHRARPCARSGSRRRRSASPTSPAPGRDARRRAVPPRAAAVRRARLDRRRIVPLRPSGCSREPSFAQMRTVHGKPIGGVYGLGLFGERVGGVEVWGHSGSYGGFQSSLLVVPDATARVRRPDELGLRCEGAVRGRERVLRTRCSARAAACSSFVELPQEQLDALRRDATRTAT